jgi:hypothetical protein
VTGLKIASFVFTDSGPDCKNGEEAQMQKVKAAMAKITTTFPKYYFSKQNMIYQQWQLTTKCNAFQGHAVEPMNIVFWTRYFNLVCNPTSPPAYAASIPACVDLGDYTNTNSRCYGGAGANNKWMDTIKQVCLVTNKYIANGPRNALRGAEHQQQLQYLNVTDTADAGELLGFEVCVVLSSCAVTNFSVVFIMVVLSVGRRWLLWLFYFMVIMVEILWAAGDALAAEEHQLSNPDPSTLEGSVHFATVA